MSAYEQIRLHIPEEVERLMEVRRIMREDLQKAIDHAETTGEKFINPSTGRSLASLRPDRVTYWVEYSGVGGDYEVHRAYSHRMEMKRGRGS
jgi:glutamate synthase (NADPH) small chain